MELILWRHAEAEEGDGRLPDGKRRLTARGEKQAKNVALWLQRHLPRKRTILVSPTDRTQQTAHALELPYEIEPRIGTGASAGGLLKAAGWPGRDGTVLLVGHPSTLGGIAALLRHPELFAGRDGGGGVWWFAGRERDGETHTVLRAVLNPDFA